MKVAVQENQALFESAPPVQECTGSEAEGLAGRMSCDHVYGSPSTTVAPVFWRLALNLSFRLPPLPLSPHALTSIRYVLPACTSKETADCGL